VTADTLDIAFSLDHLKALSFVENVVVRAQAGRDKGAVTVDVTARRKKHAFEMA